jgi:hypothetical protein
MKPDTIWPGGAPSSTRPAETMTDHEKFIAWIKACRNREACEADRAARIARNERLNEWIQEDNKEFLEVELKKLELRPATKRQYLGYFKRFERFVGSFEFEGEYGAGVMPASPGLVCIWLLSELAAGATDVAIRGMKAAISDVHNRGKVPDPTNHEFVRAVMLYARAHWKETHSYAKRRNAETSTTQKEI